MLESEESRIPRSTAPTAELAKQVRDEEDARKRFADEYADQYLQRHPPEPFEGFTALTIPKDRRNGYPTCEGVLGCDAEHALCVAWGCAGAWGLEQSVLLKLCNLALRAAAWERAWHVGYFCQSRRMAPPDEIDVVFATQHRPVFFTEADHLYGADELRQDDGQPLPPVEQLLGAAALVWLDRAAFAARAGENAVALELLGRGMWATAAAESEKNDRFRDIAKESEKTYKAVGLANARHEPMREVRAEIVRLARDGRDCGRYRSRLQAANDLASRALELSRRTPNPLTEYSARDRVYKWLNELSFPKGRKSRS